MSSRKASAIASSLKAKGFVSIQSHHEYLWYFHDGRQTNIYTKLSHDYRDYGDNLLAQVAKQLKLKRRQLDELIDCPMDAKRYLKHLQDGGFVAKSAAETPPSGPTRRTKR